MGGVIVGRLGESDGAILGGVGHSEGVALGVAGRPDDTQSGGCPACQPQGGEGHFSSCKSVYPSSLYMDNHEQLNTT